MTLAAGDPFSQAYQANGRSATPPGPQVARPGENKFAGYGFDQARNCPPTPVDELGRCVEAMKQIMADVIQMADIVPWIHPPFRSRFLCDPVTAVLSTTVGFNPATNAAGLALVAANTVPGVPPFVPTLLEMPAAGTFLPLFSLNPPPSQPIRIKSWGISSSGGPKSVLIRIKASTVGGAPTPPDPLLSSHQVSQHQDTFVVLQPDQSLVVEVSLRDTTAPVLIDFGICYWIWQTNKRIDTREGMVLRDGYSLECRQ